MSALFPYALDLPPGWTVLAFSQGNGSGEDTFTDADHSAWVTMGRGIPEPGQTVEDRVEANRPHDAGCVSDPVEDRSIEVGGERGILWTYVCPGTFHLAAQTIHGRFGYLLTIHVDADAAATAHATMAALLRRFVFTDAPASVPSRGVARALGTNRHGG